MKWRNIMISSIFTFSKRINNKPVPLKLLSQHKIFAYFYLIIIRTTNYIIINDWTSNAKFTEHWKPEEYIQSMKKHFQRKTSLKFDKFIFPPRLTLYWNFLFKNIYGIFVLDSLVADTYVSTCYILALSCFQHYQNCQFDLIRINILKR